MPLVEYSVLVPGNFLVMRNLHGQNASLERSVDGGCAMYHDRKEAIAALMHMPDQMFVDGIYVDCPKRRRREQALGQRPMIIKWPRDLKMRFATQVNKFIENAGKELGLDILIRILERWTPEDIQKAVEDAPEQERP
jgi:hypothetical protein